MNEAITEMVMNALQQDQLRLRYKSQASSGNLYNSEPETCTTQIALEITMKKICSETDLSVRVVLVRVQNNTLSWVSYYYRTLEITRKTGSCSPLL